MEISGRDTVPKVLDDTRRVIPAVIRKDPKRQTGIAAGYPGILLAGCSSRVYFFYGATIRGGRIFFLRRHTWNYSTSTLPTWGGVSDTVPSHKRYIDPYI